MLGVNQFFPGALKRTFQATCFSPEKAQVRGPHNGSLLVSHNSSSFVLSPAFTRISSNILNNPGIIRPNLQVKMPSFHQIPDEEWDAIIAYFKHIDNEKISYRSDLVVDEKSMDFKAGVKLHEFGQCNSCHFYGEEFPTGDAPTWAPNLAMTKERLNPDWVREWLYNPSDIMPGTKMPAPYLPDSELLSADGAENDWGKALVVLEGDTTRMLNGLRDYMWKIKGNTNIDAIIKDYFDENGYDFGGDEDEDDWGEDEDW